MRPLLGYYDSLIEEAAALSKGKMRPLKVFPEHPFHLCEQCVPSSSRRQYLNAVQQPGFADR